MAYNKILTVQDISCVGQCSLTVALPILSVCGLETCVLPSAVLSTHTAGFQGYTFRDLTEDMPAIQTHWMQEGIRFDAIYTGYLGGIGQITHVKSLASSLLKPEGLMIVDPAMADNGKLYPAFNEAYVEAMKGLCAKADYIIPNITEACCITGTQYKTEYDRSYIDALLAALSHMGCKNIILTGVSYAPGTTGVAVYSQGSYQYYCHEMLPNSCHGTGDIYASAFVGALLQGKSAYSAAVIAADYTVRCIQETAKLDNHWYGAAFELALPELIKALQA